MESVFRGVINLLLPGGGLMALSARGSGDAPRTLVVDVAHWLDRGVEAGGVVGFGPDGIALQGDAGGLQISAQGTAEWHPILPYLGSLTPSELAVPARVLHHLVSVDGELGGMLGPTPGAAPMEAAVCTALEHGRDELVRAVRSSDSVGMRHGVLALLGLGPGLTPAGDDFLTAIALLSSLEGSRLGPLARVLHDVLDEQPGRTTLLSTTTLREALSGRVRAGLVDVLWALAATRGQSEAQAIETVRDPVRRALAHGHTSGTDTLSGLVAGLHLERELRGSL
ncbi:oxamate carbamoyltransferase subunit AllH family protein [Streptomyces sp. NBC_00316]|uniref:oxamate carbamoyltransferase subunit AllH family protein n=1 Tax=Streptomyces sp. NBC_00316 TaxID=2975710 RepID=UPI002E27C3D5|nr:DUF2877 domain-containing protein [Streptomyces sp. NBC_00316]